MPNGLRGRAFDHYSRNGGAGHLPTKIARRAGHLTTFFKYPGLARWIARGDARRWNESHIIKQRAVPIFPLEVVEPRKEIANASARKPRLGFRAPAFTISFRGSTNSRGKIGIYLSLHNIH